MSLHHLSKIRRAAFMVEDAEGNILVYGMDPEKQITFSMDYEYADFSHTSGTDAAYLGTKVTIEGTAFDPFRHTGPFPAASAERIAEAESKVLEQLDMKSLER